MKKYSHAWIAFKAIERLERASSVENASLSDADKQYAKGLTRWFKHRKDGVINGAWYPDAIIKDNANSHVLKFAPIVNGEGQFRTLPDVMSLYYAGKKSDLYRKAYSVDPSDNLPQRCEALAHSVIDNMKIQQREEKGSPVAPTDNHIALILFMLSHYVADAHMPLHCDNRAFSEGSNLHAEIEGVWEKELEQHIKIDEPNERFFYNENSYPLVKSEVDYSASFLKTVDDTLSKREFVINYGSGNNNVMEYMLAICQYSYLLSYVFVPAGTGTNVTLDNLRTENQKLPVEEMSAIVLSDAIDSVARIWFRVWRRYAQWKQN